jgi:hypothetical protein
LLAQVPSWRIASQSSVGSLSLDFIPKMQIRMDAKSACDSDGPFGTLTPPVCLELAD